jgi:antitoxin FitA
VSKRIHVRNVDEETVRALKARAAREGRSLSDLVREELDRAARRPSRREVFDRIAARSQPSLDEPPADTVRRMRDDLV